MDVRNVNHVHVANRPNRIGHDGKVKPRTVINPFGKPRIVKDSHILCPGNDACRVDVPYGNSVITHGSSPATSCHLFISRLLFQGFFKAQWNAPEVARPTRFLPTSSLYR